MKYLVWLAETARVPADKAFRLLEHYGSGEAVYRAEPARAAKVCGLAPSEAKGLDKKSLRYAEQVLGECKKTNVRVMTIFDDDYPQRLKNIFDPPPILYVRGRLPDLNTLPAIAIVGRREATPYGLVTAERLSYHLSMAGFSVVSGIALGIDSAAHAGALKARTPPVSVLASAINTCSPAKNLPLLTQILQSGAAVSEYPPGAKYKSFYFHRRNRILSGLSLGTLVVEASERSGALITASLALDQGRDVFAVPGPINAETSRGTNDLIKKGAKLITDASDIVEEYAQLYGLNVEPPPPMPRSAPAASKPPAARTLRSIFSRAEKPAPALAPTGDPVLDAIEGETHIDAICEKTGMAQHELSARLTVLELEGKVRQKPGKHFERI